MTDFHKEVSERIHANAHNAALRETAKAFLLESMWAKYPYNFYWLGRPIIQYPQDMVAVQELIWKVRPDLIIETGIAHGGSLVLSASMLALLDYCEAIENGSSLDPWQSQRKVIGIDIDIRPYNRQALDEHPLRHMMELVEGSSVDPDIIAEVHKRAEGYGCIIVFLDSNHTHEHVLAELEAYASLVTSGSYCVVFDTVIHDLPDEMFPDRPWNRKNNPHFAVHEFLKSHDEFKIDKEMECKLLITVCPDGFLKKK